VLISLEIMRSGWSELKTALGDVMDRRPLTLDEKEEDPVTGRVDEFLRRQPWVDDVIVRVRERGREFTAEAHVVPTTDQVSVDEISRVGELACGLDPRLADVTIAPVKQMPRDVALARNPEH
jgi:divalent metal cation (Fe/Co/Zn/Cd) transporter